MEALEITTTAEIRPAPPEVPGVIPPIRTLDGSIAIFLNALKMLTATLKKDRPTWEQFLGQTMGRHAITGLGPTKTIARTPMTPVFINLGATRTELRRPVLSTNVNKIVATLSQDYGEGSLPKTLVSVSTWQGILTAASETTSSFTTVKFPTRIQLIMSSR